MSDPPPSPQQLPQQQQQQQQHACPYCRQRFDTFSTVVDHLHRNECHQVYTKPSSSQTVPATLPPSPHHSAAVLLHAFNPDLLCARGSTTWGSTFAPSMLEQVWLPQLCTTAKKSSPDTSANKPQTDDKTRPRRLTCGQCGAALSNIGNLNRHIRAVHIDIRRFKCEHCQWAFHRRSELKSHVMRVHFEVKPHRCRWCEKSYTRKEHLQRHVRSQNEANSIRWEHRIAQWPDTDNLTLTILSTVIFVSLLQRQEL